MYSIRGTSSIVWGSFHPANDRGRKGFDRLAHLHDGFELRADEATLYQAHGRTITACFLADFFLRNPVLFPGGAERLSEGLFRPSLRLNVLATTRHDVIERFTLTNEFPRNAFLIYTTPYCDDAFELGHR
jgi:hypothetical protein